MQTTNHISEFLNAVWGDAEGTRLICSKVAGKWEQKPVSTTADALIEIEKVIAAGGDCYFTPHLFSTPDREAKNAIGCRALYLDIDVKDKPGCYSSQGEALSALQSFCDSTGLPLPSVVSSGYGFHVWWLFERFLSESEWSGYAGRLKALCEAQGLKADNVTTDRARVLRVPETLNNKNADDPQKCELLTPVLVTHRASDIDRILHAVTLPTDTTINDNFSSGIETGFADDPAKSQEVARLCVAHLSAERCGEYDTWLNVGMALYTAFDGTADGLALWDEWSKTGAGYKPDVCRKKWDTFGTNALTVGSLVHWAIEDEPEFEGQWEAYKAERRIERLAANGAKIQNTDYGNAQRLVSLFGHDLRYDHTHGVWYVWNGQCWEAGASAQVMQYAKATAKAMYTEVAKTEDDTRRQALAKHAFKSESASSLKAMVSLAESEPEIQVSHSDFNSAPHLLNVANGVIDLRTGKLLPHCRELLLSTFVPIEYDPDAACPLFDAFTRRIFTGNLGLIGFMRRAVGYTLTGETREQVLFICHGSGANGKSTLLETMHFLMGDYAGSVRTEALMKHKFTGQSGHNEDIASLVGRRFVSAAETEQGQQFASSLIKQLTGGDTITASRKYSRSVSFKPTFKLWLAVNHTPAISDDGEGIWRRIRRIPFNEQIPPKERDAGLIDKLRAEAPGILAWAVRGSVEWYKNGLGTAPEIEQATASYRTEQDSVQNFIAECCEVGTGRWIFPAIIYDEYRKWCGQSGDEPVNRREFPAKLNALGYSKAQQKMGGQARDVWQGVALKSVGFGVTA